MTDSSSTTGATTAPEVPGLDRVLTPAGYLTAQQWRPGEGHGFVVRDAMTAGRLLHPWCPEVAETSVRHAAAYQGTKVDGTWDEAPGRLPHEVVEPGLWRNPTYLGLPVRHGARIVYYGSADATGEWLTTLAVAAALNPALAEELEPQWRAAGDHLIQQLGIGGGLIRWGVRAWPGTGLQAQSWRDEANLQRPIGGSVLHRDSTVPALPMADWETQASTLVGLRALARLSGQADHRNAAIALEARLQAAFDPNTMGLDRYDRPIAGVSSAAGVLLWAGALHGDKAREAAERMTQADIYTPYGVRTVASSEVLYDPSRTRRGWIYSYNSYLAVCGLRAAGRVNPADDLAAGMLEAIDDLDDYPESWTHGDDGLQATGQTQSAWTIAVRQALAHKHYDTAAGLCEPLLPQLASTHR